MASNALLRTYPNGLRARITPRNSAFMLEIYDERGRRRPDLPVIVPSLEEAQHMADDHAGVPTRDPWMPVYRDTFHVALPDDSPEDRLARSRRRRRDSES